MIAHSIDAQLLFLAVINFSQLVKSSVAKFLAVKGVGINSLLCKIQPEVIGKIFFQSVIIPLVGMQIAGGKAVERFSHHAGHVIIQDKFLLLHTFQQLAAQAVNGHALLVHHVVIFQQVFAGLKVLGFHGLLRRLDATANQARFNGNAFFHAQPLQQA